MRRGPREIDIVLLGGGHAHVFVLEAFGVSPIPGVRLTVVAKELAAPYSGMLPGFVAGHYPLEACLIDLVPLARFAGARLVHGSAIAIDRKERSALVEGQPPIRYDLLSIDVGITPDMSDIEGAREHAIAVKPVSVFAPKWQELEQRALGDDGPRRIAVVGGGAAGVELVLAARHRLRQLAASRYLDRGAFSFSLIAGGDVLPSHNGLARLLARRALARAGVEVLEGVSATRIAPGRIRLSTGRELPADAVLVSTKATPPGWFAVTDLLRDADGYLALRPTLQALNDDEIFAAGDCASVLDHPRAKAGVFAVRQGAVLADNLVRRVLGEAARPFIPQRQFLTLVSLGEKRAIAARGPIAAAGRWAWVWKDRIDRAFMARFKERVIERLKDRKLAEAQSGQ
jgi:selenide,water dikinase